MARSPRAPSKPPRRCRFCGTRKRRCLTTFPTPYSGTLAGAITPSADVLFNQNGSSAGLIARFTGIARSASILAGYIFDVQDTGAWAIYRGNEASGLTTLASGQVDPLGTATWHDLSLTTSGNVITAAIDGTVVGSATDSTYQTGPVGLETGLSTHNWPQVQYSDLTVAPAA